MSNDVWAFFLIKIMSTTKIFLFRNFSVSSRIPIRKRSNVSVAFASFCSLSLSLSVLCFSSHQSTTMGICKCRKSTGLFCFNHQKAVCPSCIVDHPTVSLPHSHSSHSLSTTQSFSHSPGPRPRRICTPSPLILFLPLSS